MENAHKRSLMVCLKYVKAIGMSVLLTAWNSGLMLAPAIGGRISCRAAWIIAMTIFFIFWFILIISGPSH